MATIGQTLSAARIAAGCSLENLSTRTRIRIPVLKGIEDEDFVPCGGDFYARGHIRRICKHLGLDPAPLLEEYDREHASSERPTFVPPPRHPSARNKASRVAAAQDGQAPTGSSDHEASREVLRRFGDESTDPEQRAERWGHFERNQKLARGPRRNRPRPAAQDAATAPAAAVPEPRRVGRHAKPSSGPAEGVPAQNGTTLEAPAVRPPLTRTRTRGGERVRRHWPWAVVVLIVLAGVVVGVRAWQDWDDGSPVRTALESVRDGEEALGSAVLPEEDGAPDGGLGGGTAEEVVEQAGSAVGQGGEFTVVLSGSDRSWVRVSDPGGEEVYTGFLTQGQARDFVTEGPLTLWLGNAGAVDVAVDGQHLGPGGAVGEVREFTVGAEGFDD